MAHLWALDDRTGWQPILLDGQAFTLDEGRPLCVADLTIAARAGASIAIRRIDEASGAIWTLLTGPAAHVLINGNPVRHGIVVLADRDEIRLGRSALFFSTEAPARVVAFPVDVARGCCPRCQQPVAQGEPAVKCPGCGLWHHASDELPCWSYADRCAVCPQHTRLDGALQWTPEEL